jgi:hypothetical protein
MMRTNIPIAVSVMYDRKYNYMVMALRKKTDKWRRRAFSETNPRIMIQPILVPWSQKEHSS